MNRNMKYCLDQDEVREALIDYFNKKGIQLPDFWEQGELRYETLSSMFSHSTKQSDLHVSIYDKPPYPKESNED